VSCGDVSQLRLTVVSGNASGQVSGRSGGSLGARSSLSRLPSIPAAPQWISRPGRNGWRSFQCPKYAPKSRPSW